MTRPVAFVLRSRCIAMAVLAGLSCDAQEFIPNNDFEDGTVICGLYGQPSFNDNVVSWASPTIGSPDIFHTSLPSTCANSALGSSDANSWGQEAPYAGSGMLALISYCPGCATETREYAQAQLDQALVPGTSYHARLFVSRADHCRYGTNDLGLYFSVSPPSGAGWESLPNTPQVKATNILESSSGWELIAGDFIADAAYAYVTIGNFSSDAEVAVADLDPDGLGYAVYFVDEVSLSPSGQLPYITGASVICTGDVVQLTANNTVAAQWSIASDPGTVISTDPLLEVSPLSTTTYLLTQGTTTASFTVQVVPAPTVDLGNDTTLCSGAQLLLVADPPGADVEWQDGSAANTYTVAQAGTYWVTAQAGSCSTSDTIMVAYEEGPMVDLGNDSTLCIGASLLLDATAPNASYRWQNGSMNATFLVTGAGTYHVIVSGPRCSAVDSIQVAYEPLPVLGPLGDQLLCAGDVLRYTQSSAGVSWTWQDGSSNSPYTISEAGDYTVNASTALCTTTTWFTVELIECEPLVVMPNVISPNGDGVNDAMVPITLRGMARAELTILNRWGNELFRTSDPQRGWNARDVPDGTYFWVVEYTDVLGRKGSRSGYVTVLR